jgi:hypothetical protein
MSTLVSVITDGVRRIMGDDDGAVYTDATLLPGSAQGPLNQAYRWLQNTLANRGCTVLRNTTPSPLALPIGTTSITTASSPALPSDMLVPYILWERLTGSTTMADFVMVDHVDSELPNRDPYDYLGSWKFEAAGIALVGATTARDVLILYEKLLTPFATVGDTVGILGGEDCLMFKTAALMAVSRGQNAMAEYFEKQATDALHDLATRFTHSNQTVHGRRRMAYGRRATGRH